MSSSCLQHTVKTRILVLSDTHGTAFTANDRLNCKVDVAIHCGDLTEESKLDEFADTLRMLREIDAPLKLIIAGNHDFTLDTAVFQKKVSEAEPALDLDLLRKTYGDYGQARKLINDAKSAGVMFLEEGHHTFNLENGASLKIYASPYTLSRDDMDSGNWGFQYSRQDGHDFAIQKDIDLVMTHGPLRGIFDMISDRKRAGCPDLFGAIARARPKLHCFGHIHSGWGAKLVTWRSQHSDKPSHFTDIDNDRSTLIEDLKGLNASKYDDEQTKAAKAIKAAFHRQQRCLTTKHCAEDALPLRNGEQTLFINAAIESDDSESLQLPWYVEIDLPRT